MARNQPELMEQIALFQWRGLFAPQYPALRWLHSSLNGAWLTDKQRNDMKLSGMTAGIPDVFLPVRKNDPDPYEHPAHAGLYIEMKAGTNKLTVEQSAFFDSARANGYRCEVCYSWIEAANIIMDYLGIDDEKLRDYLKMNTKYVPPTPARKKKRCRVAECENYLTPHDIQYCEWCREGITSGKMKEIPA